MRRLGRAVSWVCVAVSTIAFVDVAAGQARPNRQPAALHSAADFPSYDTEVWRAQRSGLATKSASRRLVREPESPEITDLLEQDRIEDAARVVRAIIEKHPERLARAFEIISERSHRFYDEARGNPDLLQALVDAARAKVPRLSRETAARLERHLILVDRQPSRPKPTPYVDQLRAFVQKYAGTEMALRTQLDVVELGSRGPERSAALDAFIRKHPRTIAAAKALFLKGAHLGSGAAEANAAVDPTTRLLRVIKIVQELESGRYPFCEWVERAPTLVVMFYASEAVLPPSDIDTQLAAYKAFVSTHFAVADEYPLGNGTGHIITTKIADLYKRRGEGSSSVERVFTELERDVQDDGAVRYLKALFYIRSMSTEPAAERPTFYRKAIGTLTTMQAEGTGPYQRRSLATLASLYFSEGDYPRARDAFRQYVKRFPRTDWAWVAALRLGQSREALGEWTAAVASYRAAASTYGAVPLARVLGHAYAARGYEALSAFPQALGEYRTALAGWDGDYGPVYSLHISGTYGPPNHWPGRDRPEVGRDDLTRRIARLERSVGQEGGTLLEQGRWRVEHGRHREALDPLQQVLTRFPQSPAMSDARYLTHRAKLLSALELAAIASPVRGYQAALTQLEEMPGDTYDFGMCATRIARASILLEMGAATEAASLMRSALAEWHDYQAADRRRPRGPVEQDIAAIRALVIRPHGGGVLRAWGNALSSQKAAGPIVIVNPDISVRLHDAATTRYTVYQPLPGIDQVLFLNAAQQAILEDIVTALSGHPSPGWPARPNRLHVFWNRFFPTEWRVTWNPVEGYSRVTFETYPIITQLEFLNVERTKAAARIHLGHEGATVVLEKEHGVWVAKKVVNMWNS